MANLLDTNDPVYTKNQYWLRPGESTEAYNTRVSSIPKQLGIVTDNTGINYINNSNQTLDKLQGIKPEEKKVEKPIEAPKDESKGQFSLEEVLQLPGINNDLTGVILQKDGKYSLDSSALSRLGMKTSTNDQNTLLEEARRQKDDLIKGMESFMVTDEQLNAQFQSINNLYDSRIRDMEDINRRREQSVKTLGVRTGSRYTGGEGGVFGGIIAEEERAGAQRISELQAQKQAAISEAKEAARTKNWQVYAKKVESAEKAYVEQVDAVKEFNKTLVENNKKIQEENRRAGIDLAIGDLVRMGIIDPLDIQDALGGDATIKEISEFLTAVQTEKSKPIGFEALGKINSSIDGLNLPFGTTENDLANMGIVPLGDTTDNYDYRTVGSTLLRIDKRTGEQKVIYQAPKEDDPFTTAQRFTNAFGLAKEVRNSSTDFLKVKDAYNRVVASAKDSSAAGDLALIFSFMKILDPTSVVREQEFANAQNAGGVPDKIRAQYNKIISGERLSENQRKDFVKRSKELYDAQLGSQILYQAQNVDFAESFGLDPNFAVPDITDIKKKFQSQLKRGEIIVWDIKNKQAGAIPAEEFDPSQYVRF